MDNRKRKEICRNYLKARAEFLELANADTILKGNDNIITIYLQSVCYAEKRVWAEKHLGFDMLEKLILSHNKGLNNGDYLVDDHINGKGQENFEGKLLHFGSDKFLNWEIVRLNFEKQINN